MSTLSRSLEFENIQAENLKKEFIKHDKSISHKIEEIYINYRKKYLKNSKFLDLSFKLKLNDNFVICPLTLETNNDIKALNFYGEPFQVFFKKKIDSNLESQLLDHFFNLYKKFKYENSLIKIKKNNDYNYSKNDFKQKNNPEKIYEDMFIDLTATENEIFSRFYPGLRNELRKKHSELTYEIIDAKNYNTNEIFNMMNLHTKISGYQTRSTDSWKKNEEMIKKNKGFLVKVKFNGDIISYSFFYHNHYACIYFSSCSIRDYFKKFKNLNHISLWTAIQHAKKLNCNYFYIGSNTLYSKIKLSSKEKSVELFKKKFSNIRETYFLYKKIPETFCE